MRRKAGVCLVALLFACSLVPSTAQADEQWLLDAELNVGLPVTDPQIDLFGVGGTLAVGVLRSLAPWVLVGARVRTGMFLEGDDVTVPNVEDPALGTLNMAEGAVRFRLFDDSPRRGPGGWVEVTGGGGFTGDVPRGAFGGAIGWGFRVGDRHALGPHLRYLQIVENDGGLDSRDARIVLAGVSFSGFEAKPPPPAPTEPVEPADRDGDGIVDAKDICPDEPEDLDGFLDHDGCPEPDNDRDGLLDADDGCPDAAEDEDGFEDDDGCPDEDNDLDGVLDPDDQCPFEPEVLNGVQDDDGCPDQGLIEMKNDRIVLEERVLFDTDRARVRHRGWPTLRAIVELAEQHPEWTRVRIEGHADVRGDADFNQRLSARRAENVREMLIEFGMDPDILEAEGFGATRPLRKGTTDEDHRKNRRVEFVVIARRAPEPESESESESDSGSEPELEPEPDVPTEPAGASEQPTPESDSQPPAGEVDMDLSHELLEEAP